MLASQVNTGDYVQVVLQGTADTRQADGGFYIGTGQYRARIVDGNGAVVSITPVAPPALDPPIETFALVTLKAGVNPATIPLLQTPAYTGKTQVLLEVVLNSDGRKVAQEVVYHQQFEFGVVLQFFDVTTVWTPQ